MARFNKVQVITAMKETGMVPVFYHEDLEVCKQVISACYKGGVRVFEFTNRGDFAHELFGELIKWAAKDCPELILGVGTVVDAPTASLYLQLGANFIVGPNSQAAGCDVTKVFPAGNVGGPSFVKNVLSPLRWSNLMVTGAVSPDQENLSAWIKAGVLCVGMGSKLFPKDVIAAKNWQYITDKCIEALGYIVSARS